jgi:choline-sulfatase
VDPQPQLVGFDKALYPKVAHRYYGQTVFDEHANAQIVEGFLEDFFAEHVRAYIEAPRKNPFFLHYNISPPHQPIGPGHLPDKYIDMYDPEQIELRRNARTESQSPHDPQFWYRVYRSADFFWDWLAKREPRPEDADLPEGFGLRELTALYYGAITCVDDYLGRLVDTLETSGQLDHTILVFCADHGDNLGSHGLFNKNSLIEEAIRVPLIVCGPGLTPAVQENVVNLVDVAPTLLSLVGERPPAPMQGEPVHALPESVDPERATFVETGRHVAVRTATHLYGLPYREENRSIADGGAVFHDLRSDPFELSNLATTGEQGELAAALRTRLLAWDHSCPWMPRPANTQEPEARA